MSRIVVAENQKDINMKENNTTFTKTSTLEEISIT
jgi:hypothetical protein